MSLAVRLSRAVTGRQHFIVMQGGYNGNHDELACNVFNSLDEVGPRVSPDEYPIRPIGAGTTLELDHFVQAGNFNDLEAIRYVCRRYSIAALITEPILRNFGVVRPKAGYLQALRELADEYGFQLIFDEVKTGFRHAIGGYGSISGVNPDPVVYGKAIANGFPLALVGGKSCDMDFIAHEDVSKRPFVAETYNGHPVAVAAATKTVQYLTENAARIYPEVEALGGHVEKGILGIFSRHGVPSCVSRQGSAFSFYLMPEAPSDCHDIISHRDFANGVRLRRVLVEAGVFVVSIATKQCSISFAHTAADIDFTLERFEHAVAGIWSR